MPVDVHGVWTRKPAGHKSTGTEQEFFPPINGQALLCNLDPTPAVHHSTGMEEGFFSPVNEQALLFSSDSDNESCQSSRGRQRAYLHTPYPFSLRLDALANQVMCEGGQAQQNSSFRQDTQVRAGLQLPAFGCGITEEVLV